MERLLTLISPDGEIRTVPDRTHDALDRHSNAVVKLSVAIGVEMGLTEPQLKDLRLAAKLHDIGKHAIDNTVWAKAGPLNDQEWVIARTHPELARAVLSFLVMPQEVIDGIVHHHERWDGTGYPDKLIREQIPLEARIIAVADAFDVMTTTERPYRQGISREDAIEEIQRASGTHFCPKVVEAFLIAWAKQE